VNVDDGYDVLLEDRGSGLIVELPKDLGVAEEEKVLELLVNDDVLR
jgi:hypothetical protein